MPWLVFWSLWLLVVMPTQQTDSISTFSRTAFRLVWYRLWSVAGAHSDAKHTGKVRSDVLYCMARVLYVDICFVLFLHSTCPNIIFYVSHFIIVKGSFVRTYILFVYRPSHSLYFRLHNLYFLMDFFSLILLSIVMLCWFYVVCFYIRKGAL